MSPVVLADDRPVARTTHTCQLCRRTIEPGETYNRQRNVYDGAAYTFKACTHCSAFVLLSHLLEWVDDDRGYTEEDLWEYEPRNMTEARWRAQYRRKWRQRDGALYPVPTLKG